MERRLAAILAADVVGYSRLMERDEAGTLATLKSRRTEILQPAVSKHRGRIVKLMGDGVLVEFASAVNAVQCAVDLQRGMAAANGGQPEDRQIVLRVGDQSGRRYGGGQRPLWRRCECRCATGRDRGSGRHLISGDAYEDVKDKVNAAFDDLGEQAAKEHRRASEGFRVRASGSLATAAPALPLPDKPSIAVLPFQNMSGDPEQEYFADGMVEEIITALSRFRWLFVIARNSSFTYKGRAVDVKQVGRELGVRYVLEGSVRKAANRVRITGQLIDASTGAHLWADRFDGALDGHFRPAGPGDRKRRRRDRAQSWKRPRSSAPSASRPRASTPTTTICAAWRVSPVDQGGQRRGAATVPQGHRTRPGFRFGLCRAAHCYVYRRANGWMVDRAQEAADAARLARRAVQLGRDDAVALSYGGHVLAYVVGDLDDGVAFVERALDLNSNLATAWGASGWMKMCLGDPDTAINQVLTAMRLSPLDPRLFVWQSYTALAHFCARRYDDAVAWAERALRDQPNFATAMRIVATSHALGERPTEAQKAMARLRQLHPTFRVSEL